MKSILILFPLLSSVTAQATISSAVDYTTLAGREAIRETVRLNKPKLEACYREHLKREPGFKGRFDYTFIIESDGKVSSSTLIADGEFKSTHLLAACAQQAILSFEFPISMNSQSVEVTRYPFFFNENAGVNQ